MSSFSVFPYFFSLFSIECVIDSLTVSPGDTRATRWHVIFQKITQQKAKWESNFDRGRHVVDCHFSLPPKISNSNSTRWTEKFAGNREKKKILTTLATRKNTKFLINLSCICKRLLNMLRPHQSIKIIRNVFKSRSNRYFQHHKK